MSNSNDVGDIFMVDNIDQILGEATVNICLALLRLVGPSITQLVGNNEPISLLLKIVDLGVPVHSEGREPMHEQQRGLPRGRWREVVVIIEATRDGCVLEIREQRADDGQGSCGFESGGECVHNQSQRVSTYLYPLIWRSLKNAFLVNVRWEGWIEVRCGCFERP
jgi:hypothetical protein